MNNRKLVEEVYIEWNNNHNDKKISSLKCGALPSGSAVIASKEFIEKFVAPQYRKFLGIDMETYGVYYACKNAKSDIKYNAPHKSKSVDLIIPQPKNKGNGNAFATPLPYGLVFEKISDSKNHF